VNAALNRVVIFFILLGSVMFLFFIHLQEMNCLEDHIERLSPGCRKAVEAYTERADEMPELNQIFAEACQEFWKENCKVWTYGVTIITLTSTDSKLLT
jgi:hypothetical protein